jgi:type I restriction enzyme M protein
MTPHTTAQSLGSLIKSARDIMRKDKGLNGDLDRLPMLTWIMFLKFLDDLELQRETEAELAGKKFQRAIDPPYRWRDWASKPEGITGDELISFVNNEEAVLPDGSRGPGLFAYLRSLTGRNGTDRRDVIATVFKGTINRMINGYLLRDVINKVSGIHFGSSEELHTLGALYETMLREMRDAAGDSGEFYTPRPIVRFMVAVTDPKLGETILDPACGTGGFLVEAFEHLEKQCKTVQDRELLQKRTIFGGEAKPLPYLLAQMNLLLHGLESPQISPNNSLAIKITEIGERDRIDIILTNPPFGGEEERGILANFPSDKQTTETALLFLQLIMRKLRRVPKGGRAAVVVSDGFLSTKGVAARVKQQLISEFNLHTVVRLPRGVFVPYTPIATNLLFFDRSKPTDAVWFFEVPGPTDRQTYSKTKPFCYEELFDCIDWWHNRKEGNRAWLVAHDVITARDFDLDIDNPNRSPDFSRKTPPMIVNSLRGTTQSSAAIADKIASTFRPESLAAGDSSLYRPLGDSLKLRKEFITIDDAVSYQLLTVQLHARGIRPRGIKHGREIKTKKQQVVREGDLVVAEIDAKVGGFGLVPSDCSGAIVSSHYFIYDINSQIVEPRYIEWWLMSGIPEQEIQPFVKGSTNYAAIRQQHFPFLKMIIPELDEQRRLVAELDALQAEVNALKRLQAETDAELDALLPSILDKAFKGEL